ncbi:MAG: bifunctional aspartate kinase/homoserine dehydrogenase I [Bacteroidota bacterium]
MKVLKFGGSSVGTPKRIEGIIEILKHYYSEGEKFTVVFSAFGGVTDSLIQMSQLAARGDESYQDLFLQFSERHAEAVRALIDEDHREIVLSGISNNHEVLKNLLYGIFLVREASARTMDYVLSFGERNSSYIISIALQQNGLNAKYLDARKIIKTNKQFGSAIVDLEMSFKKTREYYAENPEIQIVTGFVASAKGGLTTTLGRGGSDYTAALLAAALDAEIIEIWTDVNGVLTADPRKVKKAFTIPSMTYSEAMEMAHFGAKVIYPPTIQPALNKNIPIKIKNTFNPTFSGTFISHKKDPNGRAVKGISSIGNIALLTLQGSGMFGVPGTAGRLFNTLAQEEINIILITQGSSEYSISFAIQPRHALRAKKAIEKTFAQEISTGTVDPVKIEDDLCVVAIIGENMRYQPGIAGRLFRALGKNGINIVAIAQGSSELNISVVVDKSNESKALNALHDAFFLSGTKELHLFIVGVGLIGSTLLKQIKQHTEYLKSQRSLELKVVGLANSKKMIFNAEGINLDQWKEQIQAADEEMDMNKYLQKIKSFNLSNAIFIDNTAEEHIADYYEAILDASISISTPNKIATSSSYLRYKRLKSIAQKRGVRFMYETNVGAGLPVISTLNDLIVSGDRIIKIEGVLSGSLSYIFNNFNGKTPFSDIVKKAQELGYTEPDPRVDLSGQDVKRKVVILAREMGLSIEPGDVEIENILPEKCQTAKSVEAFFEALEETNEHFETMRMNAEKENKVLRFLAKIEDKRTSIVLEAVTVDNPFYSLDGSDNMIVFTTDRYKDRPLVVRGPGAGGEVTAAGVFAEVLTIGDFLI